MKEAMNRISFCLMLPFAAVVVIVESLYRVAALAWAIRGPGDYWVQCEFRDGTRSATVSTRERRIASFLRDHLAEIAVIRISHNEDPWCEDPWMEIPVPSRA